MPPAENACMKSEAAIRLEEAAMIVAAIARQWRATADQDDSGLISLNRVDEIIEMTESTARNLVKLAASWLPDDLAFERHTDSDEVERFLRVNEERLEEELAVVLDGRVDS